MGKNILTKKLLLRSVGEWNTAREAYPDLKPDLCGVDLTGANLERAVLYGSDLRGAILRGVNLREADLSRADLSFAILDNVNLSRAVLNEALIIRASFNRGILIDADLNNARLGFTTFGAVDLSKVIGLETVLHSGPSTLGIDTIYASNGNIPEVFLRGCGLPDAFIKAIHELNPKATDYYSCFISHSSADKVFVDRLYSDLQEKDVRCYYAPHDLPIGAKTRPTLHEEIRNHDKLLLVLSEDSVKSGWVEDEVEHAFDLEKERGMPVLFPIRLDDAVMVSKTGWASSVRIQRNIGDFTKWENPAVYQDIFKRLLKDLKKAQASQ